MKQLPMGALTGDTDNRTSMTLTKRTQGKLLVITGPSGVGKGTLVEKVMALVPNLKKSVSVTTRTLRAGELEGVDYFFKTPEQFQTMLEANEFMEWAKYAGNYYGTPRLWVENEVKSGVDVILELEVQGAKQIRESDPEAVLIFLAPPSFQVLEERLRGRATESPDKLALRLTRAKEELKEKSLFQYEVINDNLEDAVNKLVDIVYSERASSGCGGNRLTE